MKSAITKHYRQGDVLLEAAKSLPKKGLTEVPAVDGKFIVALGTSNGNPHYFVARKGGPSMFRDEDGGQHFKLPGIAIKGSFPILEENKLRILIQHAAFGKLAFAHDDARKEKGGVTVKVSGKFEFLYHAEHDAHAIPAGIKVHTPQRGFNRGEIRRVTD